MQNGGIFLDNGNKYILCLADLITLVVVIHSIETDQQALLGVGGTDSPNQPLIRGYPQSVLRESSYDTQMYISINCFSSEFNS